MLQTQLTILFYLLFSATSCWAVDPGKQQSNNIIENLITTLPGSWHGQAIETPVGPVDYDITFHQCDGNLVAGVAELDVSNHHWQFRLQEDVLHLTFLSTFRGNSDPVELVTRTTERGSVHFRAPELDLLTLSVTPSLHDIDIRVFHHQKPHVLIRLSRISSPPDSSADTTGVQTVCKKL